MPLLLPPLPALGGARGSGSQATASVGGAVVAANTVLARVESCVRAFVCVCVCVFACVCVCVSNTVSARVEDETMADRCCKQLCTDRLFSCI